MWDRQNPERSRGPSVTTALPADEESACSHCAMDKELPLASQAFPTEDGAGSTPSGAGEHRGARLTMDIAPRAVQTHSPEEEHVSR